MALPDLQTRIDQLESAMALGVLEVRQADGARTVYQSIDQMSKLVARLRRELGGSASSRTTYASFDGCD